MCTFTFTGNVQVGFQLQIEYDILMYLKLKSTFKRNTEQFAIDSPHVSLFYIRFFYPQKSIHSFTQRAFRYEYHWFRV